MKRDVIVSVSSLDQFDNPHMGNVGGSIDGPLTKQTVMLMIDKWLEDRAKSGISISADKVMIVNVWVSEA